MLEPNREPVNSMHPNTRLQFVLVIQLALPGCYSTSPLDVSPQVRLDRQLLGTWRCVGPNPEAGPAAVTFAVAADREREYDIEAEKDPESYRAFISRVRDQPFLNVRPRAEDESAV